MSNVKKFKIEAVLPYDFWDTRTPEVRSLTLRIARLCLSGSITKTFRQEVNKIKNKNGGLTTMIRHVFYGYEALSWGFLSKLNQDLHQECYKIDGAWSLIEAKDVENSGENITL